MRNARAANGAEGLAPVTDFICLGRSERDVFSVYPDIENDRSAIEEIRTIGLKTHNHPDAFVEFT
jgi:hypothetical protein